MPQYRFTDSLFLRDKCNIFFRIVQGLCQQTSVNSPFAVTMAAKVVNQIQFRTTPHNNKMPNTENNTLSCLQN